RHGERRLANIVLNRYLELRHDYGGLATLPLFLSCRAAIRAHVAATQARLAKGDVRGRVAQAETLVGRTGPHLQPPPPQLIAIGGMSGTGKTTVARALAPLVGPAPGAVVIRSDVTRKQIMGVPETSRLSPDGYRPEVTEKVFAMIAAHADEALAAGHVA